MLCHGLLADKLVFLPPAVYVRMLSGFEEELVEGPILAVKHLEAHIFIRRDDIRKTNERWKKPTKIGVSVKLGF